LYRHDATQASIDWISQKIPVTRSYLKNSDDERGTQCAIPISYTIYNSISLLLMVPAIPIGHTCDTYR